MTADELTMHQRWALNPKLGFPECLKCKHLRSGQRCDAFPSGIPGDILSNDVVHNTILPDQSGEYIFEKNF